MNIDLNLIKKIQFYIDNHYQPEDTSLIFYQTSIIKNDDEDDNVLYQECYEPNLLDDMEPTFSQTLFKFIKQQNISEIDCYKNANIDRKLFSKIRSNDDYNPKKDTVFALIIGLKLNLNDAEKLLDSAGYSISHSLKKDVIIEYAIKEKIYNIIEVNNILDHFQCSLIGQ